MSSVDPVSIPLDLNRHHMWSVGDKLFEAQATTDAPLRKIEPTDKKVFFGISIDQKEDGTPYIFMHVASTDEEGYRWGHHLHAKVDLLDEQFSEIGNKLLQINAIMEEKDKVGFDVNLAMKSITTAIRSIQERQPSAPLEETKPVSSFVPVRCIMGDPNLQVIRGPAPDGTPEVDHHVWYKEAYGSNQTVEVLARTDEKKNNKALDLAFHITTEDIHGDWWECIFYEKVDSLDAFSVVLESKLREINTAFVHAGLTPLNVLMAKSCLLQGIQAIFDSNFLSSLTVTIRPDLESKQEDAPLLERTPEPSVPRYAVKVPSTDPLPSAPSSSSPARPIIDEDHTWFLKGNKVSFDISIDPNTRDSPYVCLDVHVTCVDRKTCKYGHGFKVPIIGRDIKIKTTSLENLPEIGTLLVKVKDRYELFDGVHCMVNFDIDSAMGFIASLIPIVVPHSEGKVALADPPSSSSSNI